MNSVSEVWWSSTASPSFSYSLYCTDNFVSTYFKISVYQASKDEMWRFLQLECLNTLNSIPWLSMFLTQIHGCEKFQTQRSSSLFLYMIQYCFRLYSSCHCFWPLTLMEQPGMHISEWRRQFCLLPLPTLPFHHFQQTSGKWLCEVPIHTLRRPETLTPPMLTVCVCVCVCMCVWSI
jgi:hypothetical protein